ncbi:hypothetical protein J19TS2_04980 [Cohnella xylanilytica]|uniref:Uncharacterized protein n=1 Tax=Cohnella xylanilytica TaxID=557555 RepID=A0A841U8C9_9BACL|nr:hypothetical protein [Cohnella xylanilytica]MBB6694354.1 hypothetical protein [Cohnella xylanilytica]GIO10943.1 hypothetical protein J19TS2_04980 [Cohnella xylanilytica]
MMSPTATREASVVTGGFSRPGSKEAGRPPSAASPPPDEGAAGELDGASGCGVEGFDGFGGVV